MMTFNEWKKGKSSLFNEIGMLIDSPVLDLDDVEYLDMAFSHLYGNRDIPSSMESDSLTDVARKIVVLNKNKWTNHYNLLYNELVSGVANETTVTETGSNSNIRSLDRNTQANVSAFNDLDYSPDSENVEGLIDDNEQNHSKSRTEQRKSLWAIQEQLRMTQQNFIQDVVFKDIGKLITISVY